MKNLDEILSIVGGYGFYQKRLLMLFSLPIATGAVFMVMMAYAMYTPDHSCEYTMSMQNRNVSYKLGGCEVKTTFNELNTSATGNRTTTSKCTSWEYKQDTFYSTFTTENNLVCDNALKTAHAQMIYYFGVVCGDIAIGLFSDRFGRKSAFMFAVILLFASSLAVSWAPEFYSFVVLEFIVGFACRGMLITIFVFATEFVGQSTRCFVAVIYNVFFAIGLCVLSGVGYFVRYWQYIQIGSSLVVLLSCPYWWFLSESPRWLISNGHQKEAADVLKNVARTNKTDVLDETLSNLAVGEKERGKLWHLFQSRIMLPRTLIVFFNWFSLGLTYYGVFLHAGNLGIDFYLAQFIFSVIEIPILFGVRYPIDRFGRTRVHFVLMIVGGVACISSILPVMLGGDELQPLLFTLAIIGKIGASGAFGSIYVLSGEVYPTVIRNGAIGASSSCARIGSMVAPYVAKSSMLVSGRFGEALPLIIFGVVAVSAGSLCLLLPETKQCTLPDTIADAENFGSVKKYRKGCQDENKEEDHGDNLMLQTKGN